MHKHTEVVSCQQLAKIKIGLILDGDVVANFENIFKYLEEKGVFDDVKVCDESLQKTRFVVAKLSATLQTMQENHIRHNGEI